MTERLGTRDVTAARWLLIVLGVASILLGLVLVIWPGRTLTSVLIVIGLYMLFFGLVRFLTAVFGEPTEYRWLQAFLGIVGVTFGVVVIRQPEGALALVVLLVGLFWLISGLVDAFSAATNAALPDRGSRAALSVLAIVGGIALLLWPAATVTVLAIIAGIELIVSGAFEIVAAARLRAA